MFKPLVTSYTLPIGRLFKGSAFGYGRNGVWYLARPDDWLKSYPSKKVAVREVYKLLRDECPEFLEVK